jgi:hypothetical protein
MFTWYLCQRIDIYPLRRTRPELGSPKSHPYILPQFPAICKHITIRSPRLKSQEFRVGTHADVIKVILYIKINACVLYLIVITNY